MDVNVDRAKKIESLVKGSAIEEVKLDAQHISSVLEEHFGYDTGSKEFDKFVNGEISEIAKDVIVEAAIDKKIEYLNKELSLDGYRELSDKEYNGIVNNIKDESELFEFSKGPIDYIVDQLADSVMDWFFDAVLSDKNIYKEIDENSIFWNEWEFDEAPSSAFENAESTLSPIVIDLDGDGIETLSQQDGIYFDHDKNGMAEQTGWVSADDGLLVRDLNGDGEISNGSELFGNNTQLADGTLAANGYEALQELDENGDGVIDTNDAQFDELRIWQDKNSDGLSQSDELLTLEEAGIASINTDYSTVSTDDGNGNIIKQTSLATKTDETIVDTADIWFGVNLTRTIETDLLDLSDEIQALPDATAFGNVRSLRQAMARDQELTDQVTQFTNATSSVERLSLLDDLIYQWTGSSGVDPYSRDPSSHYGHVMDARQLVTLENIVGRGYEGTWCWGERDPNPHGQAAPKLIAEYQRFKTYVYAQLLSQTEYAGAFTDIGLVYDFDSEQFKPDIAGFEENLEAALTEGNEEYVIGALNTLKGIATYSTVLQEVVELLKGDSELGGFFADTIITGSDQDDGLVGSRGDDFIRGNKGDDTLIGGDGNDHYQFNLGDGSDRIYDKTGQDQLNFGAEITLIQLSVSRNATTLFITLADEQGEPSSDQIQIDNVFDFDGRVITSAIEKFSFNNGSVITLAQLLEQKLNLQLTEGNDFIYGTEAVDQIDALGGDDYIYAGGGDDQVFGGSGNDFIQGGAGNDRLQGEEGDDDLIGESSDDQLYGGDGNDTLKGGAGKDLLDGGAGDDVLYGNAGQDQLFGGAGNDKLYASGDPYQYSSADSVLDGGTGDDQLTGSYYNNIYRFKLGDGHDSLIDSGGVGSGSKYLDIIQFNTDISPDDISVSRDGSDLLLAHFNGLDSIRILRWFDGSGFQIEEIRFNDTEVTVWNNDTITTSILTVQGDAADNDITGVNGFTDVLHGNGGNDTLNGLNGDDQLFGGEGDDVLYGGYGNDLLEGGEGDDVLNSG